jgi:hypothetical protein
MLPDGSLNTYEGHDMQQTMQNAMSALQTDVQTQLTDHQRSAQALL